MYSLTFIIFIILFLSLICFFILEPLVLYTYFAEMSDFVPNEPKHFKRGHRCKADARQIINNVRIFFEEQKKAMNC